jgi:type I restriction enzyme S subunit
MSAKWPTVRLGEVLRRTTDTVELQANQEYREVTVKLWGRGVVTRRVVTGTEIAGPRRFVAKAGQFIISRIDARNGANGIVPAELDGAVVTNDFPLFDISSDRLDASFFGWLGKTQGFVELCQRASEGTTNRVRLQEDRFLGLEIPLPPLPEQRRIVARIEELAAQIHEARSLRVHAIEEAKVLYLKQIDAAFSSSSSRMTAVGQVFRVTTGGTPSRANPAYWGGEVKWVSSGEVAFCRITDTREKITQQGVESSNAKIYPPSTVLLAMIGQGKTRGQCAILDCHAATNQNVAAIHVYETEHSPEYVYWWLFANYQRSRSTETGTAQPALSGERVKVMPIPLPPVPEQRRIVAELDSLQAEVDAVKRLQAETAAELDALLPSILDRAFKGEL